MLFELEGCTGKGGMCAHHLCYEVSTPLQASLLIPKLPHPPASSLLIPQCTATLQGLLQNLVEKAGSLDNAL